VGFAKHRIVGNLLDLSQMRLKRRCEAWDSLPAKPTTMSEVSSPSMVTFVFRVFSMILSSSAPGHGNIAQMLRKQRCQFSPVASCVQLTGSFGLPWTRT